LSVYHFARPGKRTLSKITRLNFLSDESLSADLGLDPLRTQGCHFQVIDNGLGG
jgi:hypothetical protein